MKILIITPVNDSSHNEAILKECQSTAAPGTELAITNLDHGSVSIQSRYDEAINSPYIIQKAQEGQDRGFDGVFVSCFDLPGVEASREVIDIPIIGAFRPGVFTAMTLADKFSIITVVPSVVSPLFDRVREFGIVAGLASIRQISIPVTGLVNPTEIIAKTYEQGLGAIRDDRAQAIVLGCTGMVGIAAAVHKALLSDGYDVPVVAPNAVAIPYLELLIRNKLTQSRLTYYKPSDYNPKDPLTPIRG